MGSYPPHDTPREEAHVTSTRHVRLRPSAMAQAMVATSHTPVMVCTALSARMTMGRNVRWKISHRAARPSTADDCSAQRRLRQRGQRRRNILHCLCWSVTQKTGWIHTLVNPFSCFCWRLADKAFLPSMSLGVARWFQELDHECALGLQVYTQLWAVP